MFNYTSLQILQHATLYAKKQILTTLKQLSIVFFTTLYTTTRNIRKKKDKWEKSQVIDEERKVEICIQQISFYACSGDGKHHCPKSRHIQRKSRVKMQTS